METFLIVFIDRSYGFSMVDSMIFHPDLKMTPLTPAIALLCHLSNQIRNPILTVKTATSKIVCNNFCQSFVQRIS